MECDWSTVKLKEVLEQVIRTEEVMSGKHYKVLGAKWYAKGLYIKSEKDGSEIKAKKLYVVKEGDFVYNRLFAWKGSFAIVPNEFDGCYVSNEFPSFKIDTKKIHLRYLLYFFSRNEIWSEVLSLSMGVSSISRNRLKVEKLLSMEIPLPSLEQQKRIVARIESMMAKVEEARKVKDNTVEQTSSFWKMLSKIAREVKGEEGFLGDIVEFQDSRRIPLSKGERTSRQGQYPYYGASGIIDYIDDYIFDEELLLLSEDGANLLLRNYPIAFIVSGKYWVNNHAHVIRPNWDRVDIKFLRYVLMDYDVSVFNFASAQPKLNQTNAKKIKLQIPPLPEQRRIVAHLDSLQAKVDELKKLQIETEKDLEDLVPSILDSAFKGEL